MKGSARDPAQKGVVRAIERGLRVLQAIGRQGAEPAALAEATGIDRATVYRILHTLEVTGYLVRNPSDHRYRLTRQIRLLGDNYSDALWATELGAPEVGALFREVGWPTNLATFDEDRMLVRESTHRFCSFMTHRTMVGARVHMATSLGMAFAAHAPDAARAAMTVLYAQDANVTQNAARDHLLEIKSQGYALASEALEENITAMAVPIFYNGIVTAAINIVVSARLMPLSSIVSTLLPPLFAARERLERSLAITSYGNPI